MTRLVDLGSRRLALGLEWDYCGTRKDTRETLRRVSRWGAYFTLRGSGRSDESWIGVAEGVDSIPLGTLPGAAYFAEVFPDAVISWPLQGGEVWLCVIAGGRPVAGFDKVVGGEAAERESRDVLNMFGHLKRVGGWPGTGVSIEDALERIDQQIDDTKGFWRRLRRTRVLRRGLEPVVVRTALMGLLAAAGLVWQLLQLQGDNTAAVVSEARADDQAVERARINAQAGLSRYLARVAEEAERVGALAGGSTLLQEWQAVLQARAELPVSRGGYRPTRLACADGKCSVNWEARGMYPSLEAKTLVTGKPLDPKDLSYLAVTELDYQEPKPQAGGNPFAIDAGLFQVRLIDAKRRMPTLATVATGAPQPIVVQPEPGVAAMPQKLGHFVELSGQLTGDDTLARTQQLFRLLESYPAHLDRLELSLDAAGRINAVVFRGRFVMAEPQGEPHAISVRR